MHIQQNVWKNKNTVKLKEKEEMRENNKTRLFEITSYFIYDFSFLSQISFEKIINVQTADSPTQM